MLILKKEIALVLLKQQDQNKLKHCMMNFHDKLRKENIKVETGIFGAMMKVSLVNVGPVTIIIDSKNR